MFAQLVIGPPGSGKTTYCLGMRAHLVKAGRPTALINLDPANELHLPSGAAGFDVDVRDLVDLEDVMQRLGLGPNGALIYCIEFLHQNLAWLVTRLQALNGGYLLFDCPGQVELYTHNPAMRAILEALERSYGFRVCVVHLLDSHHCADPAKFISGVLVALSTMMQLEMPHINVLSKVDLVRSYGKLPFRLDFFTEVLDLNYLLEAISDDPAFVKFRKLNEALVGLIQDQDLVQFAPLDLNKRSSIESVVELVDKALGFADAISSAANAFDLRDAAAAQ